MKTTALLLGSLLTALTTSCLAAPAEPPPVSSVPKLDLQRYAGKWFEIASFPMFFQRKCIADTTANYLLKGAGAIEVTNRCRTDSGFDQVVGSATPVAGSRNAQLKISFFRPFKADYWVIGIDPEYRWAVVGKPNRENLWILARTPQLPKDQLDAALAAASAQGYDLSALRYTPQTGKTAP